MSGSWMDKVTMKPCTPPDGGTSGDGRRSTQERPADENVTPGTTKADTRALVSEGIYQAAKKIDQDPKKVDAGGNVIGAPVGNSVGSVGAALTGAGVLGGADGQGAHPALTTSNPGSTADPTSTSHRHGDATAAEQVNLDEARRQAKIEFNELRATISREPGSSWRLGLVDEVEGDFMRRLETHQGEKFPLGEVRNISEMFQEQLSYGREIRSVVDGYPNLSKQQRQDLVKKLRGVTNPEQVLNDPSIPPDLRAALVKKIETISAGMMSHHDPSKSGVLTELHNSMADAFGKLRRDNPGGPNGEVIFPSPPASHNQQMNDQYPKDDAAFESSARSKLAAGDRAGGLADLNHAIENGGSADAFAMRAALRLEDGDYSGAREDATRALALHPGDMNALGILKSTEGRSTAGAGSPAPSASGYGGGFASGGFGAGAKRDIPGMTSAASLASGQKIDEARRALSLGDVQAAIALARRALELDSANAAAHGFLSSAYARMGDYRSALASANAGLALSPRDAALLNAKAFAENRSKLYRDALASSNGAIEADSRGADGYANRAHAHGGLGDREAMLSDIRRAASLDPRYQASAAQAEALQLPSNADVMFLFPGENADDAPAVSAPRARARSFGAVAAAGVLGGLLLAMGLLSTVLAPLKESVVSAFTKATRVGPSVHALEVEPAAEPAAPASPGLIRGQYEILRRIGEGGMGTVYEGTDRSLGRRVAIKKMRDELRASPRERERFIIEAKTVASMHHSNIVDIYAIAEEGEDVYLVFEHVDGKTVHELVQSKGRLSPAEAVRLTGAMSSALSYAHSKGVIHRDMKPSNVMLSAKGDVKVMDFGIARMAKDAMTRYSMTQNVVGTPPYMAPEQEQGVVRKESDVYSLAICAYEMLTGKLPFIGIGAGMLMNKINMSYIPPSRAIAGLPESLDEVFARAFQADPERRYRAPQEFSAALESALGGIPDRA